MMAQRTRRGRVQKKPPAYQQVSSMLAQNHRNLWQNMCWKQYQSHRQQNPKSLPLRHSIPLLKQSSTPS